ncbi:MAG TPA: hypothetical protein VMG60_14845 [Burkholderiaceae bacterium]|nr:hypothetical protein [Burkholderiaceae bacterium]
MSAHGHAARDWTHRIRQMSGRDPHERGRTVTALELPYGLVFVVAIGPAANQGDLPLFVEP